MGCGRPRSNETVLAPWVGGNAIVLLVWLAMDAGAVADAGQEAAVFDTTPADAVSLTPIAVTDPGTTPLPHSLMTRVRGRVIAKGTKEALPGASVTVDMIIGTEADDQGRFEVQVRVGRRHVQIQHPGFEPLHAIVEVRGDADNSERLFRLMPRQNGERYETVITSPDERAARTSLRGEELTRVPGSFGDPFRVVESLPGVSQVLWPLAIYAIRGANPGNTGFFVDGVRVPALFHFALGPSVIHPFFLQQVDFYPGGYPVRFGRYVSGIVSGRTASPQVDRVHGSADVRLFDAGGIVAAPWHDGQGTVAAAGRFSYTGLLFSTFSQGDTLNYWDYQIRADHRAGTGKLTVFAFGSGDNLGHKVDHQSDASLSFHRTDIRWEGLLGGGRLEAAMLFGRDTSAVAMRQLFSLPFGVEMLTAAPRLVFSRTVTSWLDVEVGADAEAQRYWPRSELPQTEEQDVFRERDVFSGGAFAGFTLRLPDRLAVSPGVRVDAFAEEGTKRVEPSPRLSVRYRPAGQVWLKANAGRFVQLASMPVSVPGFDGFGLATYGTQRSWQGSFGVETPAGKSLSLEATAFYQRLRLSDLESIFNPDPQVPILEMRDGQSYGVEVMLRRSSSERLYGWLAYTLSKSERLIGHYRVRAASDWDQRHVLNAVAGYRLKRGYSLGARFHVNTGRPYPVYDQRTFHVDYQRLPTFYQLDLRADKRFVFDRYVLDVYVEAVNVTRTREVFDLQRDPATGKIDKREYRIVLPSIGVHGEF